MDTPRKGDRWRSPATPVYRITSVRRNGAVYGKQELPSGRYGAVALLNFNPRDWTFLTGVREK